MSRSNGVLTRQEIKDAAERHAALLTDMRARHLAAHQEIENLSHLIDRRLFNNAELRARWEAEKAEEDES